MSYFSFSPNRCRVDFFKPSGKWYTTEEIFFRNDDWEGNKTLIHKALYNALDDANLLRMLNEFDCICLEPYHEHKHPICIKANKFQRCL